MQDDTQKTIGFIDRNSNNELRVCFIKPSTYAAVMIPGSFSVLPRFRFDVGFSSQVSQLLVLKVKRRLAAGKDLQASPRKAKKPILTPRVVGGLKKRIKVAPMKFLRRVAKEANISRESVLRVVRGAGWRSLRKVKVPLISAQGRQTRIERATGLINALKSAAPGKIAFFFGRKDVCGRSVLQRPE